jgi:hypothetical protein
MNSNPVMIAPERFFSRELANERSLAKEVFAASKFVESSLRGDRAAQEKPTLPSNTNNRLKQPNSRFAISLASQRVIPYLE